MHDYSLPASDRIDTSASTQAPEPLRVAARALALPGGYFRGFRRGRIVTTKSKRHAAIFFAAEVMEVKIFVGARP